MCNWLSPLVLGVLALMNDGSVAGGRATAAPSAVTVPAQSTTTLVATMAVGRPVERAVVGRAFGLAVAQDRERHWSEAAALYQQAVAEWSAEARVHPTVALEHAIQKAERERQRSVMLANLDLPRPRQPDSINRAMTLERARLLRTKLMVVRANNGVVPDVLYAHTRQAFEQAFKSNEAQPPAVQSEIHLLLCAVHGAAGARGAARLALAHVPSEQRQNPTSALPMAICSAALGEEPAAIDYLETHLRQRIDAFTQRELFLANDWDLLRGDPRFDNLFAGLASARY